MTMTTICIIALLAIIITLTVIAGVLEYRLQRARDDIQAYQAMVGDLADDIARNDRKRGEA